MRQIVSIENPALYSEPDGTRAIAVKLRFHNGTTEDISIPIPEIANLNGFFLMLNQFLVEQGECEGFAHKGSPVGPIKVHREALGLESPQLDKNRNVVLMLDIGASQLGFEIPIERWMALHESLPIPPAGSVHLSGRLKN